MLPPPPPTFDLTALAGQLARAGFDLVHSFDARTAVAETGAAIDLVGQAVGVFVGNTRALWPAFTAARAADAELATAQHPLDLYSERTIDRAAQALSNARVFYTHRTYAGAFLPMQRLAAAAGIATLAPTQLLIHPTYGPWFALRALIICDGEPPPRVRLPPVCTCDARCTDAFARAVSSTGPERWRAWLAVREACTVGRDYRYSDEQIEHHYSALR